MQQRLAAAGFVGGTNDRAGGFGRQRIQEKDFRRVDKFPGGEDEWKAWEFDFKVSARAADAILVEAMEVAEIESKDITAADFSELEDEKWDGLAALTELCPPDIRDLIFQTVDSGLKFDTMKEKVISWASNKVASRKEMPVPMDIGRLKDVQDWEDQTQEEEWHEVGAVGDSCHRCGGGALRQGVSHRQRQGQGQGQQAKAKASTEPGPKDGNGQGKERAWAKVKARLDCRFSATDAVSMAIVSPVARNGRLLRLSNMEKFMPRKKPCKWLVYAGTLDVLKSSPKSR